MKEENAPVWLEIYRKFPPKFEPYFGRPAPQTKPKEIFYEEDILRAKINQRYRNLGDIDLKGKGRTKSQMCINLWRNFVSEGIQSEQAMEKAMYEIYETKSRELKSPPESNSDR